MRLNEVVEALEGQWLHAPDGWESRRVGGVVVSDLISELLVSEVESPLVLTSLLSDQVLRTAEVIEATGVVLVNRRHIPDAMVRVAGQLGLPLLHTPYPKFDACVRLGSRMGVAQ